MFQASPGLAPGVVSAGSPAAHRGLTRKAGDRARKSARLGPVFTGWFMKKVPLSTAWTG